ncbi:hypothetical protein FQA39_LY05472 [Lamprigera yunnana]|nr:hypothetical protein FQA39_LY05472 [Lamprigera yunnana]
MLNKKKGVDAGDSDSFATEGGDGLLMTFKRFSFTVDTKRGVDTELEIGRRLDGELDATDGELHPEVLFEGLAQEETVWPKFTVESSSNNFKNTLSHPVVVEKFFKRLFHIPEFGI